MALFTLLCKFLGLSMEALTTQFSNISSQPYPFIRHGNENIRLERTVLNNVIPDVKESFPTPIHGV